MLRELLHGLMAQTAEAAGSGTASAPIYVTVLPWIAMVVAMYYLIIRPSSTQADKQKQLLSQLKKGEEVLLTGGIYGKVVEIREADAIVEIAKDVKIRVLKTGITGPSVTPEAKAKAAEAKVDIEKKA